MKIIILAAGRGSRMQHRTDNIPKCMCKVAGKTILERCLDTLDRCNINRWDIGIVTGYRNDLFKEPSVRYFHNSEWENTNMFVSLTKAEEWLENEPCIVCYSDIIFSENAILDLINNDSAIALTYYTEFLDLWSERMENPLDDLETFVLSEDKSHLIQIGKKPSNLSEIDGQYMGLIRFTPESWGWVKKVIINPLPKPIEKLDMTTLLNALIEDGKIISAIPNSELWRECDTEKDIEVYENIYSDIWGGLR